MNRCETVLELEEEKGSTEKIISLEEFPNISLLFGNYNRNIKLMREAFHVKIIARDNLKVYGEKDAIERVACVVEDIKEKILREKTISETAVEKIIEAHREVVEKDSPGRIVEGTFPIAPRTAGQRKYMQAIRENEIVFAIGPAGTGKTFIAVAMALEALRLGAVKKIVLVRPAVEAGEKLGFLPGDFQAKIDPYLRPLYDSLYTLLDFNRLERYMEKNIIEIAPLAYMRGRTLESSFIILDEAQNTTELQMKMFLTRLGIESRIVVTGDITQVDLPQQERSGLVQAQNLLQAVSGICFHYLSKEDIVRHRLVQKIVEAYEKNGQTIVKKSEKG